MNTIEYQVGPPLETHMQFSCVFEKKMCAFQNKQSFIDWCILTVLQLYVPVPQIHVSQWLVLKFDFTLVLWQLVTASSMVVFIPV
jgi:hypothetical protein